MFNSKSFVVNWILSHSNLNMHKLFIHTIKSGDPKTPYNYMPVFISHTLHKVAKKSSATEDFPFLKTITLLQNVNMDLYLKEGQSLPLPTWSDRSLRLGMGRVRQLLVSSATYPMVFDCVVVLSMFS